MKIGSRRCIIVLLLSNAAEVVATVAIGEASRALFLAGKSSTVERTISARKCTYWLLFVAATIAFDKIR